MGIKQVIKKCLIKIGSLFPTRKIILFESVPDFSDNTLFVYNELVNRGYNKKYKMIWIVNEKPPKESDYKFVILGSFIYRYYAFFSKAIIFCNRSISKYTNKQFSIYLRHGNPIKNVNTYYIISNTIDYCLCTSENMIGVSMNQFNIINKNKMIPLGYPRNDAFDPNSVIDISKLLGKENKKVIVWYPTYKKHKGKSKDSFVSGNALPIIHNLDNARRINEMLASTNCILVMKPHFAQDVSDIKDMNLENIIFINDSFFKEHEISSYEFLNSCDALLTDYSSVYYDFTLANKPIGLVWEDIDQYKEKPGFAVDLNFYMKGGVKIYTCDELISFIEDISKGIDKLEEERREIRDYVNISTDCQNTKRVVDFIIERAKL